MAEQTVKYGTYEFNYNKINVARSIVYDSNDIKPIYETFTFIITAYVWGEPNFCAEIATMEAALGKPAQTLEIKEGGDTCWKFEASTDLFGGPKPKDIIIGEDEIIGGLITEISFTVECTVTNENNPYKDFASEVEVISHVYDTDFDIDISGYSTRSIKGTMKVKFPDCADKVREKIFDLFKIPGGFKRSEVFNFKKQTSEMVYTLVDREITRHLPAPITEGNASYKVFFNGRHVKRTFQGTFKGPKKDGVKKQILEIIMSMAKARFPKKLVKRRRVKTQEIQEDIYENSFSFTFASEKEPRKKGRRTLAVPASIAQVFMLDKVSTDGNAELITARGSAGLSVCDLPNPDGSGGGAGGGGGGKAPPGKATIVKEPKGERTAEEDQLVFLKEVDIIETEYVKIQQDAKTIKESTMEEVALPVIYHRRIGMADTLDTAYKPKMQSGEKLKTLKWNEPLESDLIRTLWYFRTKIKE